MRPFAFDSPYISVVLRTILNIQSARLENTHDRTHCLFWSVGNLIGIFQGHDGARKKRIHKLMISYDGFLSFPVYLLEMAIAANLRFDITYLAEHRHTPHRFQLLLTINHIKSQSHPTNDLSDNFCSPTMVTAPVDPKYSI